MPSAPYVVNQGDCPLQSWDDPVRGAVTWRTLISGDRTRTEGLTMGVADVGQGPIRLHRHAQVETYYVLSGEGVVHIDGADHPLTPGAAVFIPGGALHGARATGPDTLRLLYVFAADSFDQVHYEFPPV